MPIAVKTQSHLDFTVQSSEDTTAFGGAVVADAIARDAGLWSLLADSAPALEHRKDTSRGSRPDAIIAQILMSFVTGGTSVADAGRLANDPALARLVGLPNMADETTLCKWLNAQSEASVRRLWDINRSFLKWVFEKLTPEGQRDLKDKLSVFFDDTQVEVDGKHFEDATVNYEGNRAYSFQSVWLGGKWLAAGRLDSGSRDCSAHMKELLLDSKELWHPHAETGNAHFFADSGSSAGKYLTFAAQYGWSWTISYNKHAHQALEGLAAQEKESAWGEPQPPRPFNGKEIVEEHTWLRHQPGEDCLTGHDFATVRYKASDGGDLFYKYAFVVCGQANKAPAPLTDNAVAAQTFAIHRQKGAFENCFSNLLGDLDLHHPPCQRLWANAAWFALGALANNLLRAMQCLAMPAQEQKVRLRTIIRWWITTPVKLTAHAGRKSARVYVPAALKRFWADLLAKVWAKRARGGQTRNAPPDGGKVWALSRAKLGGAAGKRA